jgi:hypothetical protein
MLIELYLGGGAVTELHAPTGFHLYNNRMIAHDDIAAHLETGGNGEWITDPSLLLDVGNSLYVVARRVRSGVGATGSLTFVIRRDTVGELEIALTAWLLEHE